MKGVGVELGLELGLAHRVEQGVGIRATQGVQCNTQCGNFRIEGWFGHGGRRNPCKGRGPKQNRASEWDGMGLVHCRNCLVWMTQKPNRHWGRQGRAERIERQGRAEKGSKKFGSALRPGNGILGQEPGPFKYSHQDQATSRPVGGFSLHDMQ